MKPCSKNRKLISWLVLGVLDARKTAALREHMALCEGCRRYREEILNIAEKLLTAEPDANIQASELFHQRVTETLRGIESDSAFENLAARLRGTMLNWRIALPATAALVIAVLGFVTLRQHTVASLSPPVRVASVSDLDGDLPPTLANYQMLASRSLEKLDEVLTRQGNKRLPPAPIYTALALKPGNAPF